MKKDNSFPRIPRRTPLCRLVRGIPALILLVLASTAALGQGTTRPVARLITASGPTERNSNYHHGLSATNAPEPAAPVVAASSIERRAFDLINAERASRGLPRLVWDGALCRVARGHSSHMGRLDYFDHLSPDGRSLLDRARAGNIKWRSLGENIAFSQGVDDPVALAVNQWMNSPKHRDNILRGIFTHSAIGIERTADGRVYLTQVFITR